MFDVEEIEILTFGILEIIICKEGCFKLWFYIFGM